MGDLGRGEELPHEQGRVPSWGRKKGKMKRCYEIACKGKVKWPNKKMNPCKGLYAKCSARVASHVGKRCCAGGV